MIFITVGSRDFQFNRLLKAIDLAIEHGEITDEVFAQIGSSTIKIKNYKTVNYLDRGEFNKKLDECDMVLTHGGTGVIVSAVKMGKRVVAVPRLAKYHEAVDDHQLELVKAFEKNGMVTGCYDCKKISEAITFSKQTKIEPYISNTQKIIESIEHYILFEHQNDEKVEKRKIRILMCGSARNEKGGMNSVIDQLMDHNWSNDYIFSYLATHITGNPLKKSCFFFRSYLKLLKMLMKNSFDIIHIHMSYKGSFFRKYYVTKICKQYDKKVVIHLHGSEFKDFYNNSNVKLKKKIEELFLIADVTIVLGDSWKAFISSIVPAANIVVINNAVPLPNTPDKKVNEDKVILFLGALIQRKGVADLLKAVNNMVNQGIKNFSLLIAGSGEEETLLRNYTIENRLEDKITFLGWIKNKQKAELLAKSDILVLPSYNEGLPIAILEAMSYGLPIISTAVGSIHEAVDDNGYLIHPGDVDNLTEKLKTLVCNNVIFIEQSKKSRKIAEDKFSENVYFDKVEKLYRSLSD